MSEDLVGKRLGKYQLSERLGRGGMAEVYKAYHAALDRYVALKILHPFLGEDPEFKERFEREARNVAQLRHPNIVQVYDFEHDPEHDIYYMVMEYIDGPTLRTRLAQMSFRGERPDIQEAIRVAGTLADALAYAHARGMVHRDIKPANVMIDSEGRVVLTDFGIARIISGPQMTASGSMVGTPAYMSPEQGLGQAGDHRSDIYSLGVMLYQLLTGTVPFDADTPIAVVLKHVNDPLPAPSSLNPDIPPGLERILYRMLAKAPDERYQDVRELAADLRAPETLLPGLGIDAIVPSGDLETTSISATTIHGEMPVAEGRPTRRRRQGCLAWLVIVLLSLLSLAVGIYLAYTGLLSTYLDAIPGLG